MREWLWNMRTRPGTAWSRRRGVTLSIPRKLVWWSVGLVLVSTFLASLWMSRLALDLFARRHAHNTEQLAQTLAVALSRAMTDQGLASEMLHELVSTQLLDTRVSYITVTDQDGTILIRRIIDSHDFRHVQQKLEREGEHLLRPDQPLVLGELRELVIARVPIFHPPLRNVDRGSVSVVTRSGDASDADNDADGDNDTTADADADADVARAAASALRPQQRPQLRGYVIVAMHETQLQAMTARLAWLKVMVTGVVLMFSLPVMVYAARRWAAPIRALVEASEALRLGREPQTIPVDTRDEIGLLAGTFNAMAHEMHHNRLALRDANDDLERKVQQRTAELEALNQRLETEIRDKNEFLRAVSHDLGAPLRNIGGMAALIIRKHRTDLGEEAMEKLERITANVKAQTDLLNDLLELSRIRTRPGKREAIDLDQLITQVRDQFAYDIELKQIQFIMPDDLPVIHADRNRIRQVFQNLIDNAIKYMRPDGERSIRVAWQDLGDTLRFTVIDTGNGIDPKDLPQVFHVFRRGTHSGCTHIEGRGVGLASVKAIVETYGGGAWAQSQRGQGAQFHFTLHKQHIQPVHQRTPQMV